LISEALTSGSIADRDMIQVVNEKTAEQRVIRPVIRYSGRMCYFRFDSPARVCFLSVFPSPRDLKFLGAPQARSRNDKAKSGTGIIELFVALSVPCAD
jgi:hypothetical protein